MRSFFRPLMAALLALSAPAMAGPVPCPATLSGIQANAPPAGWTAFPPKTMRLAGGGLMRDRPDQEGYLRGDEKKTRRGDASVSKFAAGEEKWLWCGYGDGSIQVAKRLPDAATICTVTYESNRNGVSAISAECK